MGNDDEDKLNINDLFKRDAKLPFFYNAEFSELNEKSTISDYFNVLTKILVEGLSIVSEGELLQIDDKNNTKVVDIALMTEKHFNKVKDRFLSLGIEPRWKVYDDSDKDYYLRSVCYQAEKIKGCTVEVTMDWGTQHLHKVKFKAENNNVVPEIMKTLESYPEANYWLQLKKPTKLNEFIIKWIKKSEPDKVNILNFRKADLRDYHYNHALCTVETRHIR